MKRELAALLLGAVLMSGCASQPANPPADSAAPGQSAGTPTPAAADEVVATVGGRNFTMKELQEPLVNAYGLTMLLELVQVELVKEAADHNNVTVTPQDVENETTRTLLKFRRESHQDEPTTGPATDLWNETLTPAEHDRLLAQVVATNRITRADFELTMEMNARLRKLGEQQVKGAVTDDAVHNRFNMLYGEKAHIRYIRLANLHQISNIEDELKNGRTFDEEMKLHEYDAAHMPAIGEPPPFSRQDTHYPPEFKAVAFDLKPGQVSQPVVVGDTYFLVQLIEMIPPQHADFNTYKEVLRQDLYDDLVQDWMNQFRQKIGQITLQTTEIRNPVLREQFEQMKSKADAALHDAEELRKKLHEEQQADTTRESDTTRPSGATRESDGVPAPATRR